MSLDLHSLGPRLGGLDFHVGGALEIGLGVTRFGYGPLPESLALPRAFLGPLVRRPNTLFRFVRHLVGQGGFSDLPGTDVV